MSLVAGIDSSTQSCKVVVCDAATGRVIREGRSPHPPGSQCDPQAWADAAREAIAAAGGLDDVEAVSVAGQQHGMVLLDTEGKVIRPAMLWNDTSSAQAAEELIDERATPEAGGKSWWARHTGSVPVASFTVTKLRWVATHEPDNRDRIAAICLPHDWLTWTLSGSTDIRDLTTDRSDASGTGYTTANADEYDRDILAQALRISREHADRIVLPRILGPAEAVPHTVGTGTVFGPGCGDNAGAALGLGHSVGDATISLGTSGVVSVVSDSPSHDEAGAIAGFADATGHYLPLACTLNSAQIIDTAKQLVNASSFAEFNDLAAAAPSGADGLVYVPYLNGERTPNLPGAAGTLTGMTVSNVRRDSLARAAVEALACSIGHALRLMGDSGAAPRAAMLTGGAAQSPVIVDAIAAVTGLAITVPPAGEYVAIGAARQAAWILTGDLPQWDLGAPQPVSVAHTPGILDRYLGLAEQAAALGEEARSY